MTLYVLCGVPGSGKTTTATRLAKEQNGKLYSYDSVRRDSKLSSFDDICALIFDYINTDLSSGYDVVYDAPHTTIKTRKDLLESISNISCEKILIVMTTPFEECLKRNANRKARVPDAIIHDFYNNFEPPTLYEGWDEIIII